MELIEPTNRKNFRLILSIYRENKPSLTKINIKTQKNNIFMFLTFIFLFLYLYTNKVQLTN